MTLEIERKWLIDPNTAPFDLKAAEHHFIEQSYLSFSPQVRLRCIDNGSHYLMTVKASVFPASVSEAALSLATSTESELPTMRAPEAVSSHESLARREYEAEITEESYWALRSQTQGKTLVKTRYVVPAAANRCWEIDIYEGEFAGLAVAEMEFESEEAAAAFPTPAWALRDISTDPAYKNVVMAQ